MTLGSSGNIVPSTLRGLSRFLTNTTDNTSAFSDTNIDALLNLKYRALQTELLAALNFDWKENTLDGSGNGSVTLTADDGTYSFPTDMIQIDRMEIDYAGNGDTFRPVTIVPLQAYGRAAVSNMSTGQREVRGTTENPVAYIRNKVIHIDPLPTNTVSGGIRIWGQTLITDLSGASDEPVFEEAFHEILAYDAAQTWAASKDSVGKANRLLQERDMKFRKMVEFYSNRVDTEQPTLSVPQRRMR